MRVLITSVGSRVGYRLALELLKVGCIVHGTYRTRNHRVRLLEQQERTLMRQIVWSHDSIMPTMDDKYDVVINSTGSNRDPYNVDDDCIYANIKAASFIRNHLRQSKSNTIVVNLSSLSVYGTLDIRLIDDTTSAMPRSAYGAGKLLSEFILNSIHGHKIINFRLPSVLMQDSISGFLPSLKEELINGNALTIYNGTSKYSSCITIGTLFRLIMHTIKNAEDGKCYTFPVGSYPDITILEIIDRLGKSLMMCNPSIRVDDSHRTCVRVTSDKLDKIGWTQPKCSYIIDEWCRELSKGG